ncbi:MAG: RNA 2',3'-cyclic phosphodiesterase [bacterium]|nr:RNA 2',3'-cyclic phosphodiesterase [bacterium]
MRSFVAVELPEAIRAELAALVRRLRDSGARASWVKPDRMHLTLRFLGDVTDDQLAAMGERLTQSLAGVSPFDLRVGGVGAFPNPRRPSVIWAGIQPMDGPLAEVQAACEDAARAIGLKGEKRPFRPHLTLARVRDHRDAGNLAPLLLREHTYDGGSFSVNGVSLFTSTLTPHGPIYDRVREISFR